MRTLVIVPTHFEQENIESLLRAVRKAVPDADVLVVDDASTDDTRSIVRDLADELQSIELWERAEKGGLGRAYIDGFEYALAEGYDVVCEIDADLSHDPIVLPTMLALSERDIDVVIGSRYIPGGAVTGWPRRRTWLSRWGNRYAAIALGLAINDATAGFRAYRTDALRQMGLDGIRSDGYAFQIELTYRAVRAGCSVVEVPITFRDRIAGESKMNRSVVGEALLWVTAWGLRDALTMHRRRRAYRGHDDGAVDSNTSR